MLPRISGHSVRLAFLMRNPATRVAVAGTLGVVGMLALGGYGAIAGGTAQADSSLLPCAHVRLSQRPWMTASGVWNGPELLLVDSVRKVVLRYADSGRSLGAIPGPITEELRAFSPDRIAAQGSRLFVELEGDEFVTLDRAYRLVDRKIDVHARAVRAKDEAVINRLFVWTAAGPDIVGYADLKLPKDDWASAFVRFPVSHPELFQSFRETSPLNPSRVFYRLGYPYVASIDDRAYLLLMEARMQIAGHSRGAPELQPLPRASSQLFGDEGSPVLPNFDHREDYATVMRAVEESSMPAGIYGWENSLYVLLRRPGRDGTLWSLSRIDTKLDKLVSTISLPTRANHLTVVPGPEKWAFVEKGPVEGFEHQMINTMLLVPSPRIRDMALSSQGKLCQ